MSYYGMGDYYLAGDPGLFSTLGGWFKSGARGAIGQLPIVGPAITVGSRILSGRSGGGGPAPIQIIRPTELGRRPTAGPALTPTGRKRRRRMNYANDKALKRATRRTDGFVKLAKNALKGTGYKIVSKSSSRSARPVHIRETGPGSVTVGR